MSTNRNKKKLNSVQRRTTSSEKYDEYFENVATDSSCGKLVFLASITPHRMIFHGYELVLEKKSRTRTSAKMKFENLKLETESGV